MRRCYSTLMFDSAAVQLRQKRLETPKISRLDPQQCTVLRLDGHRFSTFTSKFQKPYDWCIFSAMQATAGDLVMELNPATAYTQSDEITLIFSPLSEEQARSGHNLPFNGRVQKLSSLAASLCSARFTYHLRALVEREARLSNVSADWISRAHFDARVFNAPVASDVVNNLLWRQHDVKKNSVNLIGHSRFSQKRMHGLKPFEVKRLLREQCNVFWEDESQAFKYGTFIKRQLHTREGVDPRTGETKVVNRTRLAIASFDAFSPYLEAVVDDWEPMVLGKHTNDTPFNPLFTPLEEALDPVRVRPGQGVVCDVDGTLLDSEFMYASAIEKVCEARGKFYDLSEVGPLIMGRGQREGAALIIEYLGLNMTVDAFLEERDALVLPEMEHMRPMPGALTFLRRCKEAQIPVALATSSAGPTLERKLELFPELKELPIVSSDDVQRGKPDPEIFLKAAARINMHPQEVWAFEDSTLGIEAAKKANMRTVLVPQPRLRLRVTPEAMSEPYRTIECLGDAVVDRLI